MKSAEYETPVQTCAERRREGAGERRWSEMVLDVHIVRECSEHLGKKTQGLRGSEDIQYSTDPNMSENGYKQWLEYCMPWLTLEWSVSASVDRGNRDSFFNVSDVRQTQKVPS